MPLAADGLLSQLSGCIDNRTEEKLSTLQFGANVSPTDIHHDRIHRIRAITCRIAQTLANGIQRAHFWLRSERARLIAKSQRLPFRDYTDAGIEFHCRFLTLARIVA